MTTEARAVQTVTGRVRPEALGRTLIHEHVLIGFPGWNLDAFAPKFVRADAMARAEDQMHELRDLGIGTFVDPCPMDLGRDVEFLAELTGKRSKCGVDAILNGSGGTSFAELLEPYDANAGASDTTDGRRKGSVQKVDRCRGQLPAGATNQT